MPTLVHRLELDLDVFAGPFDLLLSLVLRDELDLDAATEFLVLIAALLELKSRLMLPGEEVVEEPDALGPAEAAEELVERMLQYLRFRGAGAWARAAHEEGQAFLHRVAAA